MITFKLVNITPGIAAQYLSRNKANRKIRRSAVDRLKRDIVSGDWKLVHQCIALDRNGNLIDGQHRLTAIVECGVTVAAYVAMYVEDATPLGLPIDQQARRSVSDITREPKLFCEAMSAFMRCDGSGLTNPTSAEVAEYVDMFREELVAVHEAYHNTVKIRTTAGCRAAVVALVAEFPEHQYEILEQWSKFAALDVADMWPSTIALVRAADRVASVGATGVIELFRTVYYALTPDNKNVKMIRIMNASRLHERAKHVVEQRREEYQQMIGCN